MENNNWILKELNIRQDWSKKGQYAGNVTFQNGIKMEFSLLLDTEKCAKMITILKEEIVASAMNLGDMMVKSMPLAVEAPKESETPQP
jgi:chemotaxis protein CheY-P-specific phosphatase CheC